MKSYFDDDDRYNDESRRVLIDIACAIRPIIEREFGNNFSVREIAYLISTEAQTLCSEQILIRDADRAKIKSIDHATRVRDES